MSACRKIVIVFLLIAIATCYEDSETLAKRIRFYKHIKQYSNNTMDVEYQPDKGLSCIANDYLEPGQRILMVPKSQALCPYFMFPFKFELIEALHTVPGLNQTLGHEQKFSVFLLTYYLMYFLFGQKAEIGQYIIKNNLTEYMDIHEPDANIADALPKVMLTSSTLQSEHYSLLRELGYPLDRQEELDRVYNTVILNLQETKHYPMIFPWCSQYDKFVWAYSIIMSRGMSVRINEWFTLEDMRNKKKTPVDEKNIEIMQGLAKIVGTPCLVSYIDLCNHYQPKYEDMRDRKPIILDTVKGYFVNTLSLTYNPGEEMSYTYSADPSNIIMYMHYGFTMRNNIFNSANLRYDNNDEFSAAQFNLCKELNCLEPTTRDPKNMPKMRLFKVTIKSFDEGAINYARVKYLNPDFDQKKVLKQLVAGKAISYENEMNAWLWYFKFARKSIVADKHGITRSIRKAQKYINICKQIQSTWDVDDDKMVKEWVRAKHFEIIYKMDISYKMIMYKQAKAAVNQAIVLTQGELDHLRGKYLTS
jgi:hypothetical protein